jgi:hypothetical protein
MSNSSPFDFACPERRREAPESKGEGRAVLVTAEGENV